MFGFKKYFMLAACMVLASAVLSWANVPPNGPPPVNQIIGVADTTFNNLTEEECRVCHDSGVPDRHHLLVGDPIPPNSVIPVPVPGDPLYGCINCHPEGGPGGFQIWRACEDCHVQDILGENYTVHHITDTAQDGDCVACHGDIVDNRGDGHYIPTYDPSLVTPQPSDKIPSGPNGEGNCDFCHAAGLDIASQVPVATNRITHHFTGFGFDNTKCFWCHDFADPDSRNRIRVCEGCHGPDSLHNIQADSPNPNNIGTIVVGEEDPWWGHIGTNDDCFGCHGFTAMSSAAPGAGPTPATIVAVNPVSAIAGSGAAVTITAEGIVNVVDTTTYTAIAELTDGAGNVIALTDAVIAAGTLTASVPADVAAGNYELRLNKDNAISNAMNFSVLPAIKTNNIVCRGRSVTIKGAGYSAYLEGLSSENSLVALDISGEEINCSVRSWEDDKITASCMTCPRTLAVTNVHQDTANSRVRTSRSRR